MRAHDGGLWTETKTKEKVKMFKYLQMRSTALCLSVFFFLFNIVDFFRRLPHLSYVIVVFDQ